MYILFSTLRSLLSPRPPADTPEWTPLSHFVSSHIAQRVCMPYPIPDPATLSQPSYNGETARHVHLTTYPFHNDADHVPQGCPSSVHPTVRQRTRVNITSSDGSALGVSLRYSKSSHIAHSRRISHPAVSSGHRHPRRSPVLYAQSLYFMKQYMLGDQRVL